jgi:hypothetical protein
MYGGHAQDVLDTHTMVRQSKCLITADDVSRPDAPSYCAQPEETSEMVDGNVARFRASVSFGRVLA